MRTVVKPEGHNKYVQEFRDPTNNSLVSTSVREIVGDKMVQVKISLFFHNPLNI